MTTQNKQRVNIQYSVNIEEVPDLVMELLETAVAKLETVTDELVSSWPEVRKQAEKYGNYSHGVDRIINLRTELADLDYRLSDCAMMMNGLVQLANQSAQPPAASDAVEQINQAAAQAAEAARAMQSAPVDEAVSAEQEPDDA